GARVLSVQAGEVQATEPERGSRARLVVLVLAIVLAAGHQLWQMFGRPPPQPPRTFSGAPAGTMAVESGSSRFLKAVPGQQLDQADLQRFITQEERKGNVVRQTGPGLWLIEPAPAGGGTRQ
ncbi:MAG: hypothetical protein NDI82_10720, partial [Anaeromyxobacteraceae bacterium]|nr:hypothetical protein [Anaeromyxobacteraceae bacterium]